MNRVTEKQARVDAASCASTKIDHLFVKLLPWKQLASVSCMVFLDHRVGYATMK